MADTVERDQVRDQIAQALSQTPFACSSFTRLSGGTANFVYRGSLASSPDSNDSNSIIVKLTKDHIASNPDFKLTTTRCHFEEAILQALDSLPPCTRDNITIKTPHLFHFDREQNIQVLEDLPNSFSLKEFLLSEVSHGLSMSSARSLGHALGSWLRSFHDWAADGKQAKCRETLAKNEVMRDIKFYVNYTMLIDTIGNFPGILEESRDVFEQVRDFAAAEMKREDCDHEYGVIHGDFWTGNALLPNSPLTEQSGSTLFIVDWELAQIGHRALDLGQMIAELYETKLFKDVDAGVWIIEGFLEGYGALNEEMAFRVAIHVGVHLVCWGSRAPGWGSQQQVEEVAKVGRDLIVHGWMRNKAWFEGGSLGCLFRR